MKKNIKVFFAFFLGVIALSSCSKNEYESVGVVSPIISMGYVKALHNGDDVPLVKEKLMGASQIAGVVISDRSNGNFKPNELVVQNSSKSTIAGLVFVFNEVNNSINLGDSVKIDISNCVLTRENGSLKVKGSDLNFSKVTKVAENKVVTPRVITLTQLYSDFLPYENTLVQINNVTFPDLIGGTVYDGEIKMGEESNISIYLSTLSTASFSQNFLPLTASFLGIPTYYNPTSDYYNTAKTLFKMRNSDDVLNETGAAYLNFPEDFELAPASSKSSYVMPGIDDKVTFKTGVWRIYQGVIGDVVNKDRFNPLGTQSIRMQEQLSESAYLEMDFDLQLGASQVTLNYGTPTFTTPVESTFILEYSTDSGLTWTQAPNTNNITDPTKDVKEAVFNLNIVGKVRFRINKLGLGANTSVVKNGALNIDDFKVYQNID
jgi:hypothetical protein